MGCPRCARPIYYKERVIDQVPFCFRCAQLLGVVRIGDGERLAFIRRTAAAIEPWWQWTVWVWAAVLMDRLWSPPRGN